MQSFYFFGINIIKDKGIFLVGEYSFDIKKKNKMIA